MQSIVICHACNSSFSMSSFSLVSHMSKMILSLSSDLPEAVEKSTTVSRNSWKEIIPSPSLSTILNILRTKTLLVRIPIALANSFLVREVRITDMTSSVVSSSDFFLVSGFSPGLDERGRVKKHISLSTFTSIFLKLDPR